MTEETGMQQGSERGIKVRSGIQVNQTNTDSDNVGDTDNKKKRKITESSWAMSAQDLCFY